jgi:hypothetical protein
MKGDCKEDKAIIGKSGAGTEHKEIDSLELAFMKVFSTSLSK